MTLRRQPFVRVWDSDESRTSTHPRYKRLVMNAAPFASSLATPYVSSTSIGQRPPIRSRGRGAPSRRAACGASGTSSRLTPSCRWNGRADIPGGATAHHKKSFWDQRQYGYLGAPFGTPGLSFALSHSSASGRGDTTSTRSYFDGTNTETHDPAHDLDRLGRRSVCARRTRPGCTGGQCRTGSKDPHHRAASSPSVSRCGRYQGRTARDLGFNSVASPPACWGGSGSVRSRRKGTMGC